MLLLLRSSENEYWMLNWLYWRVAVVHYQFATKMGYFVDDKLNNNFQVQAMCLMVMEIVDTYLEVIATEKRSVIVVFAVVQKWR